MDDTSPSSRRRQLISVAIYAAAIILFLLYADLRITDDTWYESPHSPDSAHELQLDGLNITRIIERLNPIISHLIGWSALIGCLALLLVANLSFSKKWLCWPGFGLLLGFGLYPFCAFNHVMVNLNPWTVHSQVTAVDGVSYVLCNRGSLQGQTMAIAEVTERTAWKSTYRVLVKNNGDSPRSWASVVRPDGDDDKYGQLYLQDELLIGVRQDNQCYLAYDLRNQQAYGHGDVESLSPLVCLSSSDAAHSGDVQRTCERITEHAARCTVKSDETPEQAFFAGRTVPGCPPIEQLRAEVSQPHSPHAAIAQQLLDCYERAFAKLAQAATP